MLKTEMWLRQIKEGPSKWRVVFMEDQVLLRYQLSPLSWSRDSIQCQSKPLQADSKIKKKKKSIEPRIAKDSF